MLIIFSSIVVLGITTFIVQRLLQHDTNLRMTRCIYLAQAGIHKAIYDYRVNGEVALGQENIDSDNYFVIGGSEGNLLIIDADNWYWGPTAGPKGKRYRQLLGVQIQNASNENTLTIVSMLVSWDNSKKISTISIGGNEVWGGSSSSPATCDINDFQLNPTGTYDIDYLDFNGDMSGATINITFNMIDGSTQQVEMGPGGVIYYNLLTISSTGKTVGTGIYRTIQADYNHSAAKITSYKEISTEITP